MSTGSKVSPQSAVATSPAISVSGEQSGTRTVAIAMFCILLVSYVLMAADRYLFPVLAAATLASRFAIRVYSRPSLRWAWDSRACRPDTC